LAFKKTLKPFKFSNCSQEFQWGSMVPRFLHCLKEKKKKRQKKPMQANASGEKITLQNALEK